MARLAGARDAPAEPGHLLGGADSTALATCETKILLPVEYRTCRRGGLLATRLVIRWIPRRPGHRAGVWAARRPAGQARRRGEAGRNSRSLMEGPSDRTRWWAGHWAGNWAGPWVLLRAP